MVVARGWGEWNRKVLFNGYGVSVWNDEKVLEVTDGDGCTTMCMYLLPQNCTLKLK